MGEEFLTKIIAPPLLSLLCRFLIFSKYVLQLCRSVKVDSCIPFLEHILCLISGNIGFENICLIKTALTTSLSVIKQIRAVICLLEWKWWGFSQNQRNNFRFHWKLVSLRALFCLYTPSIDLWAIAWLCRHKKQKLHWGWWDHCQVHW